MNRRTLLTASLLPLASPAWAARMRARPGQASVLWQSRMITDAEFGPWLQVDVAGLGTVRLPSHHRRAQVVGTTQTAGRDVLIARFEGNDGTGVAQTLAALIGCDNAGHLRVLGIETIAARDYMVSTANRETEGRLTGNARGFELRVSMRGHNVPERRWNTLLPWNGDGAVAAPATPPGSPPERVRMDEARREVAAFLRAEPRVNLLEVPMRDWKIYNVGQIA